MAVEPTVRTGSWPSFGDTAAWWRSYNCIFVILTLDFNPQIQLYKLIFGGLLYIIKYSKKYHRREIFVNNLICFHFASNPHFYDDKSRPRSDSYLQNFIPLCCKQWHPDILIHNFYCACMCIGECMCMCVREQWHHRKQKENFCGALTRFWRQRLRASEREGTRRFLWGRGLQTKTHTHKSLFLTSVKCTLACGPCVQQLVGR